MANDQILKRLKWPDPELQSGDEFVRVSDIAALFAPPAPLLPGPVPAPEPEVRPRVVTHVVVESTSDADQENVPITFGQVFAPGDVPAGAGLVGLDMLPGMANPPQIPLQLDVKATHPGGSVRHAAVSGVLPVLRAGAKAVLGLAVVPEHVFNHRAFPSAPAVDVSMVLGGLAYRADPYFEYADDADKTRLWLTGPIVHEWHARAPLRAIVGGEHPHLTARIATRLFVNGRARVEVTIENAWAYEPAPQNFTYDLSIAVDGQVVAEEKDLDHFHHARWRRVLWTGGPEPAVHIKHDPAYLTGTRALPNYDLSVEVRETTLAGYVKNWNDKTVGPMKIGPLVTRAMPTTGGRDDIGLLPGWAASYLISQDERAKRVTLGTAEMAGSWSVHYRDKDTDLPISVIDYPYMTLLGNPGDTLNKTTGKREAFPSLVKATGKSPYAPDASHQPAFSYLPYLITAELYHLEELQFWAMWNLLRLNPGYRGYAKGLINREQVRGQAWSLRTLAEAAYITPDAHPLKSHFVQLLDNNIEWYSANYLEGGPLHNKLGVLTKGAAATGYKDGTDEPMSKTAASPWQDDFDTAAWGRVVELGFTKAEPMLRWKAQFPIGRMVGEGVCWLAAAEYSYVVRAAEDGPIYETFAEAYRDTVGEAVAALPCGDQVAAALGRKPGEVGNYASSATGYAANMQPALAYAAKYSPAAWDRFMSRGIKPDYGVSPQFAIIPR